MTLTGLCSYLCPTRCVTFNCTDLTEVPRTRCTSLLSPIPSSLLLLGGLLPSATGPSHFSMLAQTTQFCFMLKLKTTLFHDKYLSNLQPSLSSHAFKLFFFLHLSIHFSFLQVSTRSQFSLLCHYILFVKISFQHMYLQQSCLYYLLVAKKDNT